MMMEGNIKREKIIKRHEEKFTKFSLAERQKAAEKVESFFENTYGDKKTEKEKLKL